MTPLLYGTSLAAALQEQIRGELAALPPSQRRPALAVLLVGSHAPSQTYVQVKQRACLSVGIESRLLTFPERISLGELVEEIRALNRDPKIDGILLQSPLPAHLPMLKLLAEIDPRKDVDGFHPLNMGKLLLGQQDGFIPCTPLGIQTLLLESGLPVVGKHVAIIGRSFIVGRSCAALFSQDRPGGNATVTLLHTRSVDIASHTLRADVIIVACGVPRFLRGEMVKKGAIVIDVGIHREGNRLIGDVDFDSVSPKCKAITPVPKGVGPMTVAMLLQNTLKAFKNCRNV